MPAQRRLGVGTWREREREKESERDRKRARQIENCHTKVIRVARVPEERPGEDLVFPLWMMPFLIMNQGVDTVSTEPTRYQCSLVRGRAKRKGRGGNLEEAILMALALVTLALAILMTLALRTVALGREELVTGCLLVVVFQCSLFSR